MPNDWSAGASSGRHRPMAWCPSPGPNMYTLIATAKLNGVDPRAWLAYHPVSRLDELLPWNWARKMERQKAAA